MADYSLRVYQNDAGDSFSSQFGTSKTEPKSAVFEADITQQALTWNRETTFQLGYYTGDAFLVGDIGDLKRQFYKWLGYKVQERAGRIAWEGQISRLSLTHQGVTRVFDLEDVRNSVKASYREHLANSDFEAWTSGLPDGWSRTIGLMTTQVTTAADVARGASSVQVHMMSNLNQDVDVESQKTYRFSAYVINKGGTPTLEVYDNTGSTLIDSKSINNTDHYKRHELEFTTPANCVSIRVNIDCTGVGDDAYIDTCSLVRLMDGRPSDAYTDWYQNDKSISKFGQRDAIITGYESQSAAEIAANNAMRRYSWPQQRPPTFDPNNSDVTGLSVHCRGYGLTLLDRYVEAGDIGVEETGNAFATRAIAAYSPFVSLIRSDSAITTKVRVKTDQPERLWDVLDRLVAASTAGQIVRFVVGANQVAQFYVEDKSPTLYLRSGKLYASAGSNSEIDARQLEPGITYDMDSQSSAVSLSSKSLFDNVNHMIIDGVSVDESGRLTIVSGSVFGTSPALLR